MTYSNKHLHASETQLIRSPLNTAITSNTNTSLLITLKKISALILTWVFLAFSHVQAQEVSNYWPPAEETESENRMSIDHVGSAIRYYGKKPVYIASLYTEDPFPNTAVLYSNDGTKEIQFIIIDESMSPRRLKRILKNDLMVTLQDEDYSRLQPKINELLTSFNTELEVGSLVTLAYDSLRDATIVRHDKERKATIDGKEVFTAALKSMVGQRPPSRDFKDALLGYQMPAIDLTVEQELLVTQYIDQQFLNNSLQRTNAQKWVVDTTVPSDY